MYRDQPRKRNRLSLSCNYCKKRKVKCDRCRPCSSCIKYNVGDLCEYPDSHWSEIFQLSPSKDSNIDPNTGNAPTFSFSRLPNNNTVSQPTVRSSASNVDKNQLPGKISFSVNNGNVPESPRVQSELDMLKEKIRQIEASMIVNKQISSNKLELTKTIPPSTSTIPVPASIQSPTSSNYPLSIASSNSPHPYQPTPGFTNYNVSKTRNNMPIQLPPLNWTGNKSASADSLLENGLASINTYKYNPNTNPTFIGINPYESMDESINFYEGYAPIYIKDLSRRMSSGPFAWFTMMQKDPCLFKLWQFMMESKVEKKRSAFASSSSVNGPEEKSSSNTNNQSIKKHDGHDHDLDHEKDFREKAMDRDGYNDIRLYNNVRKTSESFRGGSSPCCSNDRKQTQRTKMNQNAMALGLTLFEGKIDQELKLIEKIEMILPKQKVIWTLINKFFVSVYPFMPFVDENFFKSEMASILGSEDFKDEKIKSLKIEKRLDLANVGVLLIILRLTYLSLFSNRRRVNEKNLNSDDPSPKVRESKYLLSNPINIDVIDMAQLCLNQFDLLRKSNLVVFQCAFLMRLYHMFAPEEGEGADGGDSQIGNGLLVQMAYSMGINREPNIFPDICNYEKINNIGRKIWFYLVMTDLVQSYQYGDPLNIDEKYFDTKLPFYREGNENIADIQLETNVISSFSTFQYYYSRLKRLLDLTLDIKNMIKMKELSDIISEFEHFLNDTYGSLKFFLKPFNEDNYPYPFFKTLKCRDYINMKSFTMTIFFHIYLFYEQKSNISLSFFYLRKVIAILCTEFLPGYLQLIGNNHINFGDAADLILNPTIEAVIHKTTQINFALLARVNTTVYGMKCDENHSHYLTTNEGYKMRFTRLCRLSKSLEKLAGFCISTMSRLSNRYYYAWRVTKAHSLVLKMLVSEEFYESTKEDQNVYFLNISIQQIDDLNDICEDLLKKSSIGKSHLYNGLFDSINSEILESSQQATASNPPSHTPQANFPLVDSMNSSETEDFQYLHNEEIDKLWFQMVSMKKEKSNQQSNHTQASSGQLEPNHYQFFNRNSSEIGNNNFNINENIDSQDMSLPLPFINPLSPSSLNNGAPDLNDEYPFNIFNHLSISQLLHLPMDNVM